MIIEKLLHRLAIDNLFLVRALKGHRSMEACIVVLSVLTFTLALQIFFAARSAEWALTIASNDFFPNLVLAADTLLLVRELSLQLSLEVFFITSKHFRNVLDLS